MGLALHNYTHTHKKNPQFFTIPLHQQDQTAFFPLNNPDRYVSLKLSPKGPRLPHCREDPLQGWDDKAVDVLASPPTERASKTAKWLTRTAFGQKICKRSRLLQCQWQSWCLCVLVGRGGLYTFTAAGVQQTILIRSRANSFKPSWGWSPWRAWRPPGPCPPPSHEAAARPGGRPGRPAAPPPPTSRSGSASPERAPSPSSGDLTGAPGEQGV